jgi:hypothetical protein
MTIERRAYAIIKPAMIAIVALALLVAACSDEDCPTCPVVTCENDNYDGRLYFTTNTGDEGLFVVDTKNDSLIDSLIWGYYPGYEIDLSDDGKLLCVSDRVFDAFSLGLLGVLAPAVGGKFVRNSTMIVAQHYNLLYTYAVPGYALLKTDTIRYRAGYRAYGEKRDELFVYRGADTLMSIDLDSLKVRRMWHVVRPTGGHYYLRDFVIGPEGRRVYCLASWGLAAFIIFDLEADSIISEFTLYGHLGAVRLHPNGREVWVTDPGASALAPFQPGTVYIFDAETGEYLEGISLYGYLPGLPHIGLDAWELEFTPDGSHVYVLTGDDFDPPSGNILRIDTKSRQVENILFPVFNQYPYPFSLAIGPKP